MSKLENRNPEKTGEDEIIPKYLSYLSHVMDMTAVSL